MTHFHYRAQVLHAEQVPLTKIADQVGTPCYVYSRAQISRNYRAFDEALGAYPHRICYAVKANSNLGVLSLLARLGAGFDIVSGGELARVIAAGGAAAQVIFSGVGKQTGEICAALDAGVGCFNLESASEMARLSTLAAEKNCVAPIAVRLNPDVDARTHPYISTGLRENKFGVPETEALAMYQRAQADPHLQVRAVACHIGSQLTELAPFEAALQRVLAFVQNLDAAGIKINHLDFGGGLGVRYADETPPSPSQYAAALLKKLRAHHRQIPITIEPGRAIVADAGVLLTRVIYLKSGETAGFCVVDAGMNDLLRPALYHATHEIREVRQQSGGAEAVYDVVGPVCESSDFLGKARRLRVRENDLLAVATAGAYGAVMASNYNARPRPAEVMVDGAEFQVVREPERLQALYHGEHVLQE